MQILEVKNDILKISFKPQNNRLLPSDFLLIEDEQQRIIAQIFDIYSSSDSDSNVAVLRMFLIIDEDDNLFMYNGCIPSQNAIINYINPDEIVELISNSDETIFFGNMASRRSCFVKTNESFVNNKLSILSDKLDKTEIIVKNLVSQLNYKNKKTVIIDVDNLYWNINNAVVLKATEDFKLPLNVEAIDTIMKNEISQFAHGEDGSIQSIFLEIREYIQTLPEKYLPFNLFRSVVNNEYSQNPMPNLLSLRNKLWLYAQSNLFANETADFSALKSAIAENNCVVIDISAFNGVWLKYAINAIASLVSDSFYMFCSLDNVEYDQKFVRDLYNKNNVIPIVNISYSNEYRNNLTSICKNQILCKSCHLINENTNYTELLNNMNAGDFILHGDATLNLPLVLSAQKFDSETFNNLLENDIKKDVDKLLSSKKSSLEKSAKTDEVVTDVVEASAESVINEYFSPVEDTENVVTESDMDFLDELDSANPQLQTSAESYSKEDMDQAWEEFFGAPTQQNEMQIVEDLPQTEADVKPVEENAEDDGIKMAYASLDEDEPEQIVEEENIVEVQTSDENVDNEEQQIVYKDVDEPDEIKLLDDEDEVVEKNTTSNEYENDEDEVVEEYIIQQNNPQEQEDEVVEEYIAQQNNPQEQEDEVVEEYIVQQNNPQEQEDEVVEEYIAQQNNPQEQEDEVVEEYIAQQNNPQEQEDEVVEEYIAQQNNPQEQEDEVVEEYIAKQDSVIIDDKSEEISSVNKEEILDSILEEEISHESDEITDTVEEESIEELVEKSVKTKQEETTLDSVINAIYEKASKKTQQQEENDDEIEIDMEEDEEEEIAPPPIKEKIPSFKTPVIPIYETDNQKITSADSLPFVIGDRVYHPKHGKGIVEGFTNYSDKILFCQINFEDVGRRILDPKVADIKKIS